ncbi:putative aliphatic sulfonates binding protein [Bradyrhizobium diazoefficiens SEMIA 5080]|uniref:Putative aliphatic sulfonates-binding protein n=2 Tax=Nitrobacteraceae TaxID=41294 RepID=A0A837CCY7_9BRAD|nr:putative aliphatic sulfonates binding protein [Bradyrhizobium diazoefficiens SEMIA 5080]
MAIPLTAHRALIDLIVPLLRSLTRCEQTNKTDHMSINSSSLDHSLTRRLAASLLAAAITLSTAAASLAADTVVLRVGDQKGGNRSLLEISGYAKDLPYKIEWSEFPAAAPILEALNAGALDVGYTGDLSFLSVYAAGAPIKAIGGTRSDAKTQAILVRQDSPIKSAADLRGKRLAGTRGGWGQFLIDATLEKAQIKLEDATFAPLGPVDAKIALVAGSIDAWAVWEPYVSFATLKDKARVIADGDGLTPTITFIVASDNAIATKRAAVQDLVQRLNKARLWSLDHVAEYARSTAELTKLPEDVLRSAYTAQRTSPIVIDENVVKEIQAASDRSTRYGILPKKLDVNQAVDRSFTAAAAGSN